MAINIKKRDGAIVPFCAQKIIDAINKAFIEVDGKLYEEDTAISISKDITNAAIDAQSRGTPLTVEEVQNLVEEELMDSERKDVARAYIRYRYKKEVAREKRADFDKAIEEKLLGTNKENKNANLDETSFGGRMGEAADVVMRDYALNNLISEKARKNHLENRIYIHDLSHYVLGDHNCAARETKFCSADNGVRSFLDFEDGDIVNVITPFNESKKAIVHNFGKQKLNKITFSLAGQRFVTERFTENHRWLLSDGNITTNLKVGDKLLKAPVSMREFNWNTASEKEKYYWCLGFVLGDGTEVPRRSHDGKTKTGVKFVRLRLCGNKIKYASRFAQLKHSQRLLANGDLELNFSSVIGFRKLFPNIDKMTRKEKLALFTGLYDADGQHVGSRKSILTTNKQIADFIENEAPSLGWFILNVEDKTGQKTNYATRKFTKEYTFIGDANKYFWTVANIEEDKEEDVWCLDVEDDHSFVLPSGITTGNCLTIPFDDLLAKGFNTRQIDIRPANSINTAFQLVAVIFQLQSLCQFGRLNAAC